MRSDEEGSRLETFLRRRLGLSRPTALKALRKGWVRVDGRRAKGGQHLSSGEVVKITNYALPIPALEEAPRPARPSAPPDLVARARASLRRWDEDLVVAAKPAGVPVHRGTGHDHGWCDALACALEEREPAPQDASEAPMALTPIGRLDRDTSGLLLLARRRGAARRLFAALRAGEVARTYLALVAGRPRRERGQIELPLAKGGPAGREQMQAGEGGKAARTRWRVRQRAGRATLLEVEIDTGRTHQIRAHLAAEGHPLLGDPRYGDEASRALSRSLGVPRLFLHAARLRYPHPATGAISEHEEPLPPELSRVLEALG
ncbi:MAG: RluA family pseudouridine synthase [Planctomycetota bacterium]